MHYEKILRIAISGDVRLTPDEIRIIDTPAFQRLHFIRQLGNVFQVFSSANHTRFEHSLGTLDMADRMFTSLLEDAEAKALIDPSHRTLVRLYALLHDIGHLPFGHTLEDEARITAKHDGEGQFDRFLGPESDIGKILLEKPGIYERFRNIWQWSDKKTASKKGAYDSQIHKDTFVHDIVSSTLCADLLDYVKRDDHNCNLGISLEYRLINYLGLAKDECGRTRLYVRLWKPSKDDVNSQLRRDVMSDLIRLLEARYLIAERVYFHHAKIVGSTMIARSVSEAFKEGAVSEDDLLALGDEGLLYVIQKQGKGNSKRLAEDFKSRRLYKRVADLRMRDFSASQGDYTAEDLADRALDLLHSPDRRTKIEDAIADEIGAQPGDVLIFAPDKGMNQKLADMNVRWTGGALKPLRELDDLVVHPRLNAIIESHRQLWFIGLMVHPKMPSDSKVLARMGLEIRLLSYLDKSAIGAYLHELIKRQLANATLSTNSGNLHDFFRQLDIETKDICQNSQLKDRPEISLRLQINRILEATIPTLFDKPPMP